jgi:hypothetical protein
MSNAIKLNEITTPVLPILLPDGTLKEFDLYEVGERLHAIDATDPTTGEVDLPKLYDAVRAAFGFPAAAAATEGGAFTLTRAQCQTLKVTVMERIRDLPEQRRFFALASPGSAASTGSAPSK